MIFDLAIALAMMLVGCYGLYAMATLPKPRGAGIGPAFYPAILAAMLLCLASLLLVRSFASMRNATTERVVTRRGIRTYGRPFALLLSALVYTLLLETVGFPLLTVVLVGGLACMLDPCSVHRKLVFALALTGVAWAIFESLLGLPLPLGVLRVIL